MVKDLIEKTRARAAEVEVPVPPLRVREERIRVFPPEPSRDGAIYGEDLALLLHLEGRLNQDLKPEVRDLLEGLVQTPPHYLRRLLAFTLVGRLELVEVLFGVVARMKLDPDEIWTLIAAVLSREELPVDSPLRGTVFTLAFQAMESQYANRVELCVPMLVDLATENLSPEVGALVAEQTADFFEVHWEKLSAYEYSQFALTKLAVEARQNLGEDLREGIEKFIAAAKGVPRAPGRWAKLEPEAKVIVDLAFPKPGMSEAKDRFEKFLLAATITVHNNLDDLPLLHLYSQEVNHMPAWVVGTVEGLMALRDCIDRALNTAKPASFDATPNDGEGHTVVVWPTTPANLEKLTPPYTDPHGGYLPGLHPQEAFPREASEAIWPPRS